MSELIHKDSSSKFANVVLNFASSRGDFTVGREIHKNTSVYMLNGRKVAKSEVENYFLQVGIDLSFPERFVILQHHTIEVATKKPTELLEHLERLIGTHALKDEIREIERLVDVCFESKKELEEKIVVLEQESEIARVKVTEYEDWEKLRIKGEKMETEYLGKRLAYLQHISSDYVENIDEKTLEMEGMEEHLKDLDETIDSLKIERNNLEKSVRGHEKDAKAIETRSFAIRKEINQLQQEKEDSVDLQQRSKREIQGLKKKLKEMMLLESKLDGEIGELRLERDSIPISDISHEEEERKVKAHRLMHLNERYKFLNEKDGRSRIQSGKLIEIERMTKNVQDSMNSCSKTLKSMQIELLELENSVGRLNSVENEKKTLLTQKHKLESDLQVVNTSIDNHFHESKWFVTFLDAVKRMKSEIPGILGSLAELGSVDHKYFVSVNTVLSGTLKNSIVVTTRDVAMKAITFCRDHKIGVISCIILDETKTSSIVEHKSLLCLSKLINCDERITKCFERFSYNWYVAPNSQVATELSNERGVRRNVVTLSGELFTSSGEIQKRSNLGSVVIHSLKSRQAPRMVGMEKNQIEKDLILINDQLLKFPEDSVFVESHGKLKGKLSDIQIVSNELNAFEIELARLNDQRVKLNTFVLSMEESEELERLQRQSDKIEKDYQETKTFGIGMAERITLKLESVGSQFKSVVERIVSTKQKLNSLESKLDVSEYDDSHQKELEQSLIESQNEQDRILSLVNSENRKIAAIEKNLYTSITKKTHLSSEIKNLRRGLVELESQLKEADSEISTFESNLETYEYEVDIDELNQEKFNLDKLKEKIVNVGKNVSIKDVEKFKEIHKLLESSRAELDSKDDEIHSLYQKKTELVTTRFNKFQDAGARLNIALEGIFQAIDPNSMCYLQFPEDKASFHLGITLLCKTDRTWKPFAQLSGGQQALCACALSLSFQRLFPSPIFFYDEIDASLDTWNTEKIALIISDFASQFLCISLRPAMYTRANKLIGVYSCNNASQICEIDF